MGTINAEAALRERKEKRDLLVVRVTQGRALPASSDGLSVSSEGWPTLGRLSPDDLTCWRKWSS